MLGLAASVEAASEHPRAGAMLRAAEERGGPWMHGHDLRAIPGAGAEATIDGQRLFVGKPTVAQNGSDDTGLAPRLAQLEAAGKTVVLLHGGQPLGLVALADEVRQGVGPSPLRSSRSLSASVILPVTWQA